MNTSDSINPDVTILFPPQWIPLNPHLSICSLAGYLRKKGYRVNLNDLNVRYYRFILTPNYLRYSLQRALNAYSTLKQKIFLARAKKDKSDKFARIAANFLHIEKLLDKRSHHWETIIDSISHAVSVFNNRELFYEPFELVRAFITIDNALELISLPYFPSLLEFNSFSTPDCPFTVKSLVAFTKERAGNPFISFFERHLPRIIEKLPKVLAISVNSSSQVVGGLTLARMLKEKVKDQCHVVIGGNYFPRVREIFFESPDFFEYFADSIVLFEGEEPLEKYLQFIKGEIPVEEVPRLIYYERKEKKVLYTFDKKPPKLDEVGAQDLDGLPLDLYFSPEPVITVRASKGCYWQQCTFCDADWGVQPDRRNLDSLLQEMKMLNEKHSVFTFEFIDESIFPEEMESFSRMILDQNFKISWFCNARTEDRLTSERLQLYSKAGLKMILWGIESGSERIMKLINKGVDFHKRLDILKHADQAGIWNFAFIFFGFPSETRDDALATINFIIDNQEIIHSYGKSIFTLGKHSKISQKAKALGLLKDILDDQKLSSDYFFEEAEGMKRSEVLEMSEFCKNICFKVFNRPLWMFLRYREIIALYLKEHGVTFMQQFKFNDEQMKHIEYLLNYSTESGDKQILGCNIDSP